MAKYPLSVAGTADFPTRPDGTIIYGQHVNSLQDEVMAIEGTLGLGDSVTAGVFSLLDAPDGKSYGTLVDRLSDYARRIVGAENHVAASTNVHGIGAGSAVVGTNTTQTLTNKTLQNVTLQGTVAAASVTFSGNVTFSNDVTIQGVLNLSKPPVITDFSSAQHDHLDAAGGGTLTIASIQNLQAALDGKADRVHTHVKADITDFAHDLDSAFHTGALPVTRVSGLGNAATMNVPTTANTAAGAGQLVRGDDPRLKDARTPVKHANTHAANGSDPITPASIGAATGSHTHLYSAITNLSTFPLVNFSGNIPESRVTDLEDDLAGKLDRHATADNSVLINGHRLTVSSSAPGGSPKAGDIWIKA